MPSNRAGVPCPITRNGGGEQDATMHRPTPQTSGDEAAWDIIVTIGAKGKAAINPQADGWPQNHQAAARRLRHGRKRNDDKKAAGNSLFPAAKI